MASQLVTGRRRSADGGVIVFVVVSLFVFMAFLALVVDVGFHYAKKAEIQIQADSLALLSLGAVTYTYERRNSTSNQTDLPVGDEQTSGTEKFIIKQIFNKFGTASGYGANFFATSASTYTVSTDNLDVTAVTVSKTLPSSYFFGRVLNLPAFSIGIHSKARRAFTPAAPPRNCAFYAETDFTVGGGGQSTNAIDSYDSTNGSYNSNTKTQDSAGQDFVGEQALACSDGLFTYNGGVRHHGGISSIDQATLNGQAHRIFGNVLTGGEDDPTDHDDVLEEFTLAPGTGGKQFPDSTIEPLNLPDVTFREHISPDRLEHDPAGKPPTGSNDNLIGISGNFDAGELNFGRLVSGSGRGTITLAAGKIYYFTKIDIGSQTTLVVDGNNAKDTYIYLDAIQCEQGGIPTFDISGNVSFGSDTQASKIKVYAGTTMKRPDGSAAVLPDDCQQSPKQPPSIDISGSGLIAGDFYAPGYDFSMSGNGDFFGRFAAGTVTVSGNRAFHYDEAIGPLSPTTPTASAHRVILVE